jgi:hypothetical protein
MSKAQSSKQQFRATGIDRFGHLDLEIWIYLGFRI